MNKNFKSLIGFEGSIIDLSNKLQAMGCEDICEFGNWSDILEDNNVVVATETENYEQHIQIYFDIIVAARKDEVIEASIIKITNIY